MDLDKFLAEQQELLEIELFVAYQVANGVLEFNLSKN